MASKMTIALVLSILISGVGQMYLGRVKRGIVILITAFALGALFAWLIGWFGIFPMFAFWIWQIFDAYKIGKQSEPQPKTSSDFKQGWEK